MHRVVALTSPVQSSFELGCVVEVFGTTRIGIAQNYEFEVCAERPGLVATTSGYSISVRHGLSSVASADTVVIPGWSPLDEPPSEPTCRALRRAHARGARLVTICSGVFALAYTGLLDGRTATTHWANATRLQQAFPRIRVEHDIAFVDHGDVATSAGAGAAIELCLHLVRCDLGSDYADQLAGHMAMPALGVDRPTHATAPPLSATTLHELLEWASARLSEPLTVLAMAQHSNLSTRTLARHFADQLGTSPGAWLIARRVAEARKLLELTDLPVDAIATNVGLGTAVNLRRRFRDHVGTTPSSYRLGFRGR